MREGDADSPCSPTGYALGRFRFDFLDNWLKTSGDVLQGDAYFPELACSGPHHGGLLASSPHERTTCGRLLVLLLIHAARNRIYIEQAYFVPDRAVVNALVAAARRGVQVDILLPGDHMDYGFVRRASRSLWGPLLEAGVRIFEYQPSMLHVKALLVDEQWVVAGSANLDFRSLYRNEEIFFVIRDDQLARLHLEQFAKDRQYARQQTLSHWRQRPWTEKRLDSICALARSQL